MQQMVPSKKISCDSTMLMLGCTSYLALHCVDPCYQFLSQQIVFDRYGQNRHNVCPLIIANVFILCIFVEWHTGIVPLFGVQ